MDFVEDLTFNFEVSDASDESEDKGKSPVLLICIFTEYFTILEDFFAFEKETCQ